MPETDGTSKTDSPTSSKVGSLARTDRIEENLRLLGGGLDRLFLEEDRARRVHRLEERATAIEANLKVQGLALQKLAEQVAELQRWVEELQHPVTPEGLAPLFRELELQFRERKIGKEQYDRKLAALNARLAAAGREREMDERVAAHDIALLRLEKAVEELRRKNSV